VWASEKHYAPYIIKGLPKEQENAFRRIRYSSFIVANVFVNRSFYHQAFATYFDDAPFADLVIADWITKNGNLRLDEPTVYTLYCPIGSKERYTLLNQPAEKWKSVILTYLEQNYGQIRDRIDQIKLYRYGHHYVISYPGFINADRNIIRKPFENIFFAKDDTQGIPSLESAIWSGTEAAQNILKILLP
jgi:spermidine dehydrogenase